MSEYDELVKILRDGGWRGAEAADAIEALVGDVETAKSQFKALQMVTSKEHEDTRAERDRLKAALEALEAVRSDLPEKVSEQWLYEGVRHWHRNCDWDDPRDGWPLDRGDGATVAKILNMIPRKALGDAS